MNTTLYPVTQEETIDLAKQIARLLDTQSAAYDAELLAKVDTVVPPLLDKTIGREIDDNSARQHNFKYYNGFAHTLARAIIACPDIASKVENALMEHNTELLVTIGMAGAKADHNFQEQAD
mgnify:CR=1 FL=1